MAKSRSLTRKKLFYGKVKDFVKPVWMRVIKIVSLISLYVDAAGIAGIMIRYYRLISK